MFEADAVVMDVIYSFLEDDEFALVNYQSLQRVDPRKYERKSIFAAYMANRLSDPTLRFLYSLPVNPTRVPMTALATIYRPDAFDVYVTHGIYHPEMATRVAQLSPDVFRKAYPRGVRHYDSHTKISREYISILSHPIQIIDRVIDATDDGDVALGKWFVDRYNIHDAIVLPKKYETYMIFNGRAMMNYRRLDADAIHRILAGGVTENVYLSLSRRKDADTLEVVWPRTAGILRNAVIHGHIGIVKSILDHSKVMITTAYQALPKATTEIAKYIHDYHHPIVGSELAHEYFYASFISSGKVLSRDMAIKAIKAYGISEGAYRAYLKDGGDVYLNAFADTAHRYNSGFSRETSSHMSYHLMKMPIMDAKIIREIYRTHPREMPDTIADVFRTRDII